MAHADYAHCPGCDGKAHYDAGCDVADDVAVWHESCLEEWRLAKLAPVYDWLIREVGIDSLISRPPWLDVRTAAEHWLAAEIAAGSDAGETVEDYVGLIYAETGWEQSADEGGSGA